MTTDVPTGELPAVPPPPAGRRRRHPVARVLGAIVGWTAAVLALIGLAAHFLDTSHQSLIVLASGAWVLAPASVVALVLHLWRRGWFAVLVAVLIVAGQVVVYGPLFVATTTPSSPAATLQVLTQNLLYGTADPVHLVDRIRGADVDVFVAQELTAQSVAGLQAAGIDRLLPYSVLDPHSESSGTGLWSRYPITDAQKLYRQGLAGVSARLDLPGGASVLAMTLHPSAPFPQDPAEWYRDLDQIRGLLHALPAGPVLVGGDFNSTDDHAHFRRLFTDGWHDGADQAGAGLVRSWPSNQVNVPALVGIDHVLTRGTVVTSLKTVFAPGSDHLGLLATVVVPR